MTVKELTEILNKRLPDTLIYVDNPVAGDSENIREWEKTDLVFDERFNWFVFFKD